ncbi:ABSCISIC ACID-INSENSITIVE 5-like protein 5 isoform X2 [Rutidosis leptorrhynchoides]|uniref:ABSCISIC ACID-INSENSITIVE 5-like protein 5 isoform X2 n=1 Tax=Rutidosis leptorrhynchoides TaxID=125765 RepID=UPI003A996E74
MNFKNFGNQPIDNRNGSGQQPPGNSYPLVRQGSIYSLTFDELQNTMGSIGKDFGSMNMDELLKNIWNAEEMQTMGFSTSNNVQDRVGVGGTNLQRQGSLTLPRTLSQKTVDEVWKDLSKEYNNGFGQPDLPQRQQTLGEMTLEDFLVKAGVVREEMQLGGKQDDNTLFTNLTNLTNSQINPAFGVSQIPNAAAVVDDGGGSNNNQISFQSANLPLNGNGVRPAQQQPQPLFPKQTNLPYGLPMAIPTSNRTGVMGLSDHMVNNNMVSGGGLQGGVGPMGGLGGLGGVTVATGSPAVSSDGFGKSNGNGNGDISSVSPAPYSFNGVLRGRRSGAIEKVVERRQRRMIKNRESAARSRARKQAYTMELEAEVSELKKKNQELKRKQEEMLEMQKNQVMEIINMQPGAKRSCLKKTISGPW